MPVRQHQSRRDRFWANTQSTKTNSITNTFTCTNTIPKENCDGRDDIWKQTLGSDKYVWVTFQILVAEKGRMTSICNIWEIVIEHCRVILGTPDGVVPKNDTG